MHPLSPLIHLKGTTQTLHANALEIIISLPPINLDGKRIERRWKFLLF